MQDILYSSRPNGVHHITLNRVHKHNAITASMALELINIVDNIANNPDSKVMIMSANGTNFCAGADLNWVRDKTTNLNVLDQLLNNIMNLNIITAVYIHGKAIGGAVGLISVFDFAFATNDATFQTPEVSLGIVPKVITPYLVQSIGMSAAKEMLLTTRTVTATEAVNMSLITSIVGPGSFSFHQDNFITQTLKKDCASIRVTKELLLRKKP